MSTDELFWAVIGLSFACFIFTCLYIQDIAWFYFLDWVLISIVYLAFRYYRWQFVRCSKKYGFNKPISVDDLNTFITKYEIPVNQARDMFDEENGRGSQ